MEEEPSQLTMDDGQGVPETVTTIQRTMQDDKAEEEAKESTKQSSRSEPSSSVRAAKKCCGGIWCIVSTILISLFLCAVVFGILYFAGVIDEDDIKALSDGNPFTKEDGLVAKDPFDGVPNDLGQVPAVWRPQGEGLSVTVVNALDKEWYAYFGDAVSDWNNLSPDALDLSQEFGTVDRDCPVDVQKIKVCNGDYGENGWRGITASSIDEDNYLVAATAKMNDYYFPQTNAGERQYTMCHELGHAFGLPHSDEDFENADLGNCMDYTKNLGANSEPDATNAQFLVSAYGTLPAPTDRFRQRHLRASSSAAFPSPKEMPAWVRQAFMHHVSAFTESADAGRKLSAGWRLLHANRHTAAYQMELPEGYKLHVSLLLVDDDE